MSDSNHVKLPEIMAFACPNGSCKANITRFKILKDVYIGGAIMIGVMTRFWS